MILVCGLGQVGFRIARLLAQTGNSVSVLTMASREEFTQELVPLGIRVTIGDARSDRSLIEAGIHDADVVIACTDNDLANLEIALDARRIKPGVRLVGRMFDQALARRLEHSGIVDRAFGMSVIAAPAFAAAALGSRVMGQFEWGGHSYAIQAGKEGQAISGTDLRIAQVVLPKRILVKSNPIREFFSFPLKLWAGAPKPLRALSIGILLLSLLSVVVFKVGMNLSAVDALYFVVTTVTTTGYGDITPRDASIWLKLYGCFLMLMGSASVATVYSLITDYIVSERFNQLLGKQQVTHSGHVVVVGLGNVGFRTATHLQALGADVVVVDAVANPEYRGFLDKETLFLVGDARDKNTLQLAAVDQATAVIAATDDDTVNLSISLAAKEINPQCRAIARLFDDRFAAKVESAMDIDVALSASRIAAPKFVGSALEPESLFSFVTDGALISILPPQTGEEFVVVRRTLRST